MQKAISGLLLVNTGLRTQTRAPVSSDYHQAYHDRRDGIDDLIERELSHETIMLLQQVESLLLKC